MKRLLLAAVTVAMIAATPDSVRAQLDEAQLSDAVTRAVRGYSRLTIFDDVEARVQGDQVTLTGKVTVAQKKADLEQRVLEVAGVREVRNEIEVLPSSATDDALRRKVGRAIYGNPAFWRYAAVAHPPIHVLVENGSVTLTGSVPSDVERVLAGTLGAGHGELRLTNALKTRR